MSPLLPCDFEKAFIAIQQLAQKSIGCEAALVTEQISTAHPSRPKNTHLAEQGASAGCARVRHCEPGEPAGLQFRLRVNGQSGAGCNWGACAAGLCVFCPNKSSEMWRFASLWHTKLDCPDALCHALPLLQHTHTHTHTLHHKQISPATLSPSRSTNHRAAWWMPQCVCP